MPGVFVIVYKKYQIEKFRFFLVVSKIILIFAAS